MSGTRRSRTQLEIEALQGEGAGDESGGEAAAASPATRRVSAAVSRKHHHVILQPLADQYLCVDTEVTEVTGCLSYLLPCT
jgi:hypothetical protein